MCSRVKDFRADLLSLRTKFDSLNVPTQKPSYPPTITNFLGVEDLTLPLHKPYDTGQIRTNAGFTRERRSHS